MEIEKVPIPETDLFKGINTINLMENYYALSFEPASSESTNNIDLVEVD